MLYNTYCLSFLQVLLWSSALHSLLCVCTICYGQCPTFCSQCPYGAVRCNWLQCVIHTLQAWRKPMWPNRSICSLLSWSIKPCSIPETLDIVCCIFLLLLLLTWWTLGCSDEICLIYKKKVWLQNTFLFAWTVNRVLRSQMFQMCVALEISRVTRIPSSCCGVMLIWWMLFMGKKIDEDFKRTTSCIYVP